MSEPITTLLIIAIISIVIVTRIRTTMTIRINSSTDAEHLNSKPYLNPK